MKLRTVLIIVIVLLVVVWLFDKAVPGYKTKSGAFVAGTSRFMR